MASRANGEISIQEIYVGICLSCSMKSIFKKRLKDLQTIKKLTKNLSTAESEAQTIIKDQDEV